MSGKASRLFRILLVEDDVDDQVLLLDALRESGMNFELTPVRAADLFDYLHRRGEWADPKRSPRPNVVVLDLNMPGKNGFEVLEERRRDPLLCLIPVVVLTASWSEDDIRRCYQLGVNSFITKPLRFDDLIDTVRVMAAYWMGACETPTLDL